MPGIVGLITKRPRRRAEQELLEMLATMCHEPFFVSGTWIDESLGVYLGWVARRGSLSDDMPLRNEREDVILVFSGEDYHDPGIVSRLKRGGHVLDRRAASYLVHSYEDDSSFPRALNGRFQGVLVDRTSGTTLLFNDRYGMHRVYYHESNDAFYFAAEAKAILAVRPDLRTIDPKGLGEYLSCGCVLENRTLFRGIQILPPAARWSFHDTSVQKRSYFSPEEWEQQAPLEPEEYYEEVREFFTRNLPRYFDGKEPVAMSLTGGLDSRMIMAWKKSPPGSLSCYSFGGGFRDSRDVVVARKVASACKQPYAVIPVGDEFLKEYPYWAERTVYVTDGCAWAQYAADLYANERARQIAPIRMTGNYGGEVLRGVRPFRPRVPAVGLFDVELLPYVRQAFHTYAAIAHRHPLSFAVFQQAPWHHYGLLALEETKLSLRTPYLDNDLVRTVFRAPESACMEDLCLRLIEEGNPALRNIVTDRGLAGRRLGAGTRRRFLEFTVKAEYAYDYGMPQWLARVDALMAPFRPERLFLGRHKFYHYRVWYRDALANYVKQMLLDPRTLSRPYLQAKTVETMVRGHLRGNHNYTLQIHQVLTLELLNRQLLDSSPASARQSLTAPAAS